MKCDISTMLKLLNLNVNLLTWWSIQWMIDKITNKETITTVKQRQMDKDKSLLGATDIVFVFMGRHLGRLLFYCIVVTFWSSLLLGQT